MFYSCFIFICRLINAFDKDPGRFTVLKERLKRAGATCVSPVLSDFIQVQPYIYLCGRVYPPINVIPPLFHL